MSKNTMFVQYEWQKVVSGFLSEVKAEKIYSVEYQREKMVEDVHRIMTGEDNACVTFVCFTGYQSIDLLRLIKKQNRLMYQVTWNRNATGITTGTNIAEDIAIIKRRVRDAVDEAVKLFGDCESL